MRPIDPSKKRFTFEVTIINDGKLTRDYPSDTTEKQALEWIREEIEFKNAGASLQNARIDELFITDNE